MDKKLTKSKKQRGDSIPPGEVLPCPECGGTMTLKDSRYGLFYGCTNYPGCKMTHGAHPNGKPLGKPACEVTRDLRHQVHLKFDRLYNSDVPEERRQRKNEAYAFLRKHMGMTPEECHIGRFTIKDCAKALEILKQHKPELWEGN